MKKMQKRWKLQTKSTWRWRQFSGKTFGWESQFGYSSSETGFNKEEGSHILKGTSNRFVTFSFRLHALNVESSFPQTHWKGTLRSTRRQRSSQKHQELLTRFWTSLCYLEFLDISISRDWLMRESHVLNVRKCFQRMQWRDTSWNTKQPARYRLAVSSSYRRLTFELC